MTGRWVRFALPPDPARAFSSGVQDGSAAVTKTTSKKQRQALPESTKAPPAALAPQKPAKASQGRAPGQPKGEKVEEKRSAADALAGYHSIGLPCREIETAAHERI